MICSLDQKKEVNELKITSDRKSDLLRRKAEYDARVDAYNADKKAREIAYRNAEADVLEPIQDAILQKLSKYNFLNFNVEASHQTAYSDDYRGHRGYVGIRIRCNEYAKDTALSWNINIKLDFDGNILKESSSWSGMNATTSENIAELRQTVDALEEINNMDWAPILNAALPDWSDYNEGGLERPEPQNFDQEILEAELEDLIGTNKAILINGWGENYRGSYFAKMIGQTPRQWKLIPIPAYYVRYAMDKDDEDSERYKEAIQNYKYDTRANKSSIHPITDENGEYTIIDLDTLQEV